MSLDHWFVSSPSCLHRRSLAESLPHASEPTSAEGAESRYAIYYDQNGNEIKRVDFQRCVFTESNESSVNRSILPLENRTFQKQLTASVCAGLFLCLGILAFIPTTQADVILPGETPRQPYSVTIRGTLRANGAGFALETQGVTFYLNFGKNNELSDLARTLIGKRVVVEGVKNTLGPYINVTSLKTSDS
jgi:hypothetical protein